MTCLKAEGEASVFIPLLKPNPPQLSKMAAELQRIESSATFSNFGPTNTSFENSIVDKLFAASGRCTTTCNATLALIVALQAVRDAERPTRTYALMPAFTFAATAQAAIWAGLTPLLCDIDPRTWLACPKSEAELCRAYGSQIAVIVPCTTLGNPVDLNYYRQLANQCGCSVVVDAASALGTSGKDGRQFGTGCADPIVFSMHATKAFATGEGGLIYCSDGSLVSDYRRAINFGFTDGLAMTLGLNAKLSEVSALLALKKLDSFEAVVSHRWRRYNDYLDVLTEFEFQKFVGGRWAPMFVSVLLPQNIAPFRDGIRNKMKERGVGTGVYFHPHLANHPFFQGRCTVAPIPNADDVSQRIIALPMNDHLTLPQVHRVASILRDCCSAVASTTSLTHTSDGGAPRATQTNVDAVSPSDFASVRQTA